MKKSIVIFLALFCIGLSSYALTPLQSKAKSEIFNALKKYGTNITDEDSENIIFKYDSTTYHASIKYLNTQTLYLSLSVIFGLPEGYDPEISVNDAFNAAGNKPVCSFANDEILTFSCEMYAKDAKPFIAVLPEMLWALHSSADAFQDEYDKLSETHVQSSHFANTISSLQTSPSEFIFPKVDSSHGNAKEYIKKVTLETNRAILDMVSYNGALYQWCSIGRNSYILANGKKYYLTKADGIAISPQHTDYPGYDSGHEVALHFKLYFPALPKGTTYFDFSEGTVDGWEIKGIKLKHGNAYAINGDQIETEYHKWNCKAIEIQEGQTIVTKTVQPKNEGTFMCRSQDEYIEDADTGCKYYLLNSSIGFEISPEISYDTKAITFYEVYPALPSNVKRINISSGSQYYVKGLKIR